MCQYKQALLTAWKENNLQFAPAGLHKKSRPNTCFYCQNQPYDHLSVALIHNRQDILAWLFEKGVKPGAQHLRLVIRLWCLGKYKVPFPDEDVDVLLAHGAQWTPTSMNWIFDYHTESTSQTEVGVGILFLLKKGCSWNLDRFIENPKHWPDVAEFLARDGPFRFDEKTVISFLNQAGDRSLRVKARHRAFLSARAIVFYCNYNLFDSRYLEEEKNLDFNMNYPRVAAVAAGTLSSKDFASFLKICPSDGQVWMEAATKRNYSVLEYLIKRRHPWKTSIPMDWSSLCSYADWRQLHAAGSPCRRRH